MSHLSSGTEHRVWRTSNRCCHRGRCLRIAQIRLADRIGRGRPDRRSSASWYCGVESGGQSSRARLTPEEIAHEALACLLAENLPGVCADCSKNSICGLPTPASSASMLRTRRGFGAPEQTTEEFLRDMRSRDAFPPERSARLAGNSWKQPTLSSMPDSSHRRVKLTTQSHGHYEFVNLKLSPEAAVMAGMQLAGLRRNQEEQRRFCERTSVLFVVLAESSRPIRWRPRLILAISSARAACGRVLQRDRSPEVFLSPGQSDCDAASRIFTDWVCATSASPGSLGRRRGEPNRGSWARGSPSSSCSIFPARWRPSTFNSRKAGMSADWRPLNTSFRNFVLEVRAQRIIRPLRMILLDLIAFGGFADSKCPLTLDHGALVDIVQGLETPKPIRDSQRRVINGQAAFRRSWRPRSAMASRWGSTCLRRGRKPKSKVLILLTDGDNNANVVDPRGNCGSRRNLRSRIVYDWHRPERDGSRATGRRIRQPGTGARPVSHRRRSVAGRWLQSGRGSQYFHANDSQGLAAGLFRDRQTREVEVRGKEILGVYRIVPVVCRVGVGSHSLDRILDGNPVSFVAIGRRVRDGMAVSAMAVFDLAAGGSLKGWLSLYSRRRRRRAAGAFVAQAMWSADPAGGFTGSILGKTVVA